MPYYVYKIEIPLILIHQDTLDSYQEARTLARRLRAARAPDDAAQYRMIFARDQAEAERLLATPRDERVIGED